MLKRSLNSTEAASATSHVALGHVDNLRSQRRDAVASSAHPPALKGQRPCQLQRGWLPEAGYSARVEEWSALIETVSPHRDYTSYRKEDQALTGLWLAPPLAKARGFRKPKF